MVGALPSTAKANTDYISQINWANVITKINERGVTSARDIALEIFNGYEISGIILMST